MVGMRIPAWILPFDAGEDLKPYVVLDMTKTPFVPLFRNERGLVFPKLEPHFHTGGPKAPVQGGSTPVPPEQHSSTQSASGQRRIDP